MNPSKPQNDGAAPTPWTTCAAGLFIGIYAFIVGLYMLLFAFPPG